MSSSSEIPTHPSWTPAQAAALYAIRVFFASVPIPPPAPLIPPEEHLAVAIESIPDDIHITRILAPASDALPSVLLNTPIRPSAVPLFVYSVSSLDSLKRPVSEQRAVLWIHGGGNVFRSPVDAISVGALSAFVRRLGDDVVLVAPAYRLATAPENLFPANVQDVFSAYAWMTGAGYDPAKITLSGESSGGNAALILASLIPGTTLPTPASVGVISPAADVTGKYSPYALAQADVDLFPAAAHAESVSRWLGASSGFSTPASYILPNPADPLVSAAYMQIPNAWPSQTLIVCGGADLLVDGPREVARRLKDAGKEVEYVEVEGMIHGFQAIDVFPRQKDEAWGKLAHLVLGEL